MADLHPVRAQLLHDVFVTAIEGGMTSAWGRVLTYHWAKDVAHYDSDVDDLEGFYALVDEYGDDDTPSARHHIDRDVIQRGMQLAATEWQHKIHWQCGYTPPVNDDVEWPDFDAIDADCIVQLGLFGEVIYG